MVGFEVCVGIYIYFLRSGLGDYLESADDVDGRRQEYYYLSSPTATQKPASVEEHTVVLLSLTHSYGYFSLLPVSLRYVAKTTSQHERSLNADRHNPHTISTYSLR